MSDIIVSSITRVGNKRLFGLIDFILYIVFKIIVIRELLHMLLVNLFSLNRLNISIVFSSVVDSIMALKLFYKINKRIRDFILKIRLHIE